MQIYGEKFDPGSRVLDLAFNGDMMQRNNVVLDLSGNQPLSYIYGAIVGDTNGIYCDGTSDYISLPNSGEGESNAISLDDDFTIAIWINFSEAKSCYIFNNYQGTGDYDGNHILFHADPSGDKIVVKSSVDDGSTDSGGESSVLDLNTWYHVTMVRNKGNAIKIFINGIEDNSVADSTTGSVLSNEPWIIGKRANALAEYFHGYIQQIKVFNRALSAGEIKALCDQGRF